MRPSIEQVVGQFVGDHHQRPKPLLVGVSGGPDSMGLMHALAKLDLEVHVAHVDHGWRPTSGEEADWLKREAAKLDLPFHSKRLEGVSGELAAREARLAYFAALCDEFGCQAVVLGHHAGDQAETVFKRFVEGAPISKWAIAPIQKIGDLEIWRPLLGLSKGSLWSGDAIDDATNANPKYHRARLRNELFPWLEERLGRPVVDNLARVGDEALEIAGYLDQMTQGCFDQLVVGKAGHWLPIESTRPAEVRHLIRRLAREADLRLSREEIATALALLGSKAPNRQIGRLVVDRGHLFVPAKLSSSQPLPLTPGIHQYGEWRVEVIPGTLPATGWQDLLCGCASLSLPAGEYTLQLPNDSLGKWYNNHQVPAFLRAAIPVITEGGKVVADFLSGRSKFIAQNSTLSVLLR